MIYYIFLRSSIHSHKQLHSNDLSLSVNDFITFSGYGNINNYVIRLTEIKQPKERKEGWKRKRATESQRDKDVASNKLSNVI